MAVRFEREEIGLKVDYGETLPGSILDTILKAFPLQENGIIVLGNEVFTVEELKKSRVISSGTMHIVLILPERGLVLKFNKQGVIADTYVDMQLQNAAFQDIRERYPHLAFHFPATQIIASDVQEGAYVVIMEQVIGQTMKISDIFNRALHAQIKDLYKVFYLLLNEYKMPIGLDIMGAKEGVRCALYGLELIDDFTLGNLIVTDDYRIVLVDSGLSLSRCNNLVKNVTNALSMLGQIATIEHMYAIASEKGESFIR